MTVPEKTGAKQDTKFKKGVSGNPKGRPKGSISIKDRVRQYLEKHPKDMESFVKHFVEENRELAWQMLEGRPQQDVVSDGKALPTPILAEVIKTHGSTNDDSVT